MGKLPGLDAQVRRGWEEIEALLEGRPPPPRQLSWAVRDDGGAGAESGGPCWREVDVRAVRVERVREFGAVYLSLALWRRLGLHECLAGLLAVGEEAVPWATVASILTAARFCGQWSELGIAQRWYRRTALEDLLGVRWAQINDDRLYRGLDALHVHKEKLWSHLLAHYQRWFAVRFDKRFAERKSAEFLLYDITNTYFEGTVAGGTLARRGDSCNQRPDCRQVCIGLVVTPEGLPVGYEVFAGNRTDVTTLPEIVTAMEGKYGQPERIWVVDRDMVSDDNLACLRARRARYIVGTPKAQLRDFAAALLEAKDWQHVREDVEVKLLAHPDGQGQEQFVLCRSQARREKEKAMLARQQQRLLEKLLAIDTRLRARPARDAGRIERSVGRWLGRYPAAAKLLEVRVEHDEQSGAACVLFLACRLERGQWTHGAHGAYLLRTNCTEKDPSQLWRWYLQLTQAEAAFRTSKSDLHLRPVFHRKDERVAAHIVVCFLALALWRALEMRMQGKGPGTYARQPVGETATIRSLDVVVPVRTAAGVTEMRLRSVARPEPLVAQLLQHLDLELSAGSRLVESENEPEM